MAQANDINDTLKELDYRASDGLEVWLLWQPGADRVIVDVVDAKLADGFRVEVPASRALDAFRHPFAYAAFGGVEFAETSTEPVYA